MEPLLFEEVGAILRSLVPGELGDLRKRTRRWGIKAWFDAPEPPREHYEAQVIGPGSVPAASVLALEVGFHAEHRDEGENERAISALLAQEAGWRPSLGREAEGGAFLGRATGWRRLSETWPDPDLGDPELAFELAARLADYVIALEPVRRSGRPSHTGGRGVAARRQRARG